MLAVYAMKTVSVDCPAVLIVSVYRQCCLCMRFVLSKPAPPPTTAAQKASRLSSQIRCNKRIVSTCESNPPSTSVPPSLCLPSLFSTFPLFLPFCIPPPHPTPPTSRASRSKPAV